MSQGNAKISDSWDYFDRIFCISLDEREDRRHQARESFQGIGLLERVEFMVVKKHPENREEGIYESHMSCLRAALQNQAERILIFEDDVFFKDFSHAHLQAACTALEKVEWEGFSLGCISDGSQKSHDPRLRKITYRCLAHAYALNRPFAEKIVACTWSGIPYDELLRQKSRRFYALSPMCAFQGLSSSDNQTTGIDIIRRCLGGLPFIQRSNEMYQNNRLLLLLLPLILLSALLFFQVVER